MPFPGLPRLALDLSPPSTFSLRESSRFLSLSFFSLVDILWHRNRLMGPTGSGKSTFINLATQSDKKLQVGHSITSCTDTVDFAEPFELDGRRIFLLDTPGFDDTNRSQLDILRIIASAFEKQYRRGFKLHGIIYLHRISDIRVSGEAKSNFSIFSKICGDGGLKNVIITTTMWSKVSEADGRSRVHQLEDLDDFFKPALQKGAQMMHHKDDSVQSAHKIIRTILNNKPFPLALQTELVDDRKPIEETMAGQEVDMNVMAVKEGYEMQLRELQVDLEHAVQEKDEETRRELEEETAKAQAQIDQLKAEQETHAANYKMLQESLYAAEVERRRTTEELMAKTQRKAEEPRQAEERSASELRAPRQHAATLRSITSGSKHTMFNKKHECFASLHWSEPFIVAKKTSPEMPRRQWIFTQSKNYWTIQSAETGKYMSADSQGYLYTQDEIAHWKVVPIIDTENEFYIYASGTWNECSIALTKDADSRTLQIVKRSRPGRDEVWIIDPK